MKNTIISLSVIVLSCCSLQLHASRPAGRPDSLSVGQIDASDYSLMKRWRPKDAVPFENGRFSDNLFVGVSGTGFRTFYPGYSLGPRFSVHIGKWFDAYNAVRIAPGVGYYFENLSGLRVKQVDVRASYLFNISSYLGGYRPSRFIEVSAVAGLGYAYSWKVGYTGHSASAHLGLNVSVHVLKNLHLYAEPIIDLSVDGLGQPVSAVPKRVMPFLCGTVGLSYRFGNDSRAYIPDGNWFMYLAGGSQLLLTENVLENMSVNDAFGWQGAFGAGRRFWNFFAFRMSAVYSRHNWDTALNGDGIAAQYIVGRLEAMLDLVALIGGRDDNRFSLSLMLGPEAGVMLKDNIGRRLNPIVGVTGGVQAKTRLSDRFSIFMEPRFSWVPYPALSGLSYPVNRNHYEWILNCNFGVEFDL